MIVMDRKGERVYFDTIEEAKEWSYCDDEYVTTAEDLEEWMTKENGGICIHTFDEVEEDDKMKKYFTFNNQGDIGAHDVSYETALENLQYYQEKYPEEEWEMAEQD